LRDPNHLTIVMLSNLQNPAARSPRSDQFHMRLTLTIFSVICSSRSRKMFSLFEDEYTTCDLASDDHSCKPLI
jgi:hypothetical protein